MGIFTDRPVDTGLIPPSVPVPPSASASSPDASGKPKPPPAATFYVTQSGPTGSSAASYYELHSYPIGIVDHALGLNGSATDSIRYLVDVTNPNRTASAGSGGGNTPDYKSFTLGNFNSNVGGSSDNGDDGRAEIDIEINLTKRLPPSLPLNGFSYGGTGHGKWLLVQRGSNTFVAGWYDGEFAPPPSLLYFASLYRQLTMHLGTSIILQNYRLVDITYEPATA